MPKRANLIGNVYGRLKVISLAFCLKKSFWKCKCVCGNITTVNISNLKSGNTHSCGCLHSETSAINGKNTAIHGMARKRIYHIWNGLLMRCENKNSPDYMNYGGRGITVCKEWHEAKVFIEWAMSHGYQDSLTIDRINNDRNYEPSNCRWTTWKQQANNRRKRKNTQVKFDYANKSGFKGVSWCKNRKTWRTTIGNRIFLGIFKNKIDAAKAYDKAAIKEYGPQAITNKSLGLL